MLVFSSRRLKRTFSACCYGIALIKRYIQSAYLEKHPRSGLPVLKERKVGCLNPMDNNIQDHPILLGLQSQSDTPSGC